MEPKAELCFSYALMKITARKIARMILADSVRGWEYFDMHAGELSAAEKETFKNAVIDEAIRIQSAA